MSKKLTLGQIVEKWIEETEPYGQQFSQSDLKKSFDQYCEANGHKKTSLIGFIRSLGRVVPGLEIVRLSVSGQRERFYKFPKQFDDSSDDVFDDLFDDL